MMERQWKPVPRAHASGGYVPAVGDKLRLTLVATVATAISDYGIQVRNYAGSPSHTIYLNQDDVEIEIEAPPKPDEPLGLGAVVEDSNGTKWLRHDSTTIHRRWLNTDDCDTRYLTWDDIAAVKVLSEGVQP